MDTVMEMLFPERKARNIKFDLAISSSNQIQNLYKLFREGNFEIDSNQLAFTKVYPHDKNSPAIFWISDTELILFYPPHSTPYNHSFKDKFKNIECLSGKLFDKNSNKKLFAGDNVIVKPNNDFWPYTENESCFLKVSIIDSNPNSGQLCE
jgi:hypothetical protein